MHQDQGMFNPVFMSLVLFVYVDIILWNIPTSQATSPYILLYSLFFTLDSILSNFGDMMSLQDIAAILMLQATLQGLFNSS
jgi:hypothetical protein